jgi:hypothetical protein
VHGVGLPEKESNHPKIGQKRGHEIAGELIWVVKNGAKDLFWCDFKIMH